MRTQTKRSTLSPLTLLSLELERTIRRSRPAFWPRWHIPPSTGTCSSTQSSPPSWPGSGSTSAPATPSPPSSPSSPAWQPPSLCLPCMEAHQWNLWQCGQSSFRVHLGTRLPPSFQVFLSNQAASLLPGWPLLLPPVDVNFKSSNKYLQIFQQ